MEIFRKQLNRVCYLQAIVVCYFVDEQAIVNCAYSFSLMSYPIPCHCTSPRPFVRIKWREAPENCKIWTS
uniref:Uncharacterized protein n=1 Tax=Romanomermis culicivorax TaxID=13658 RepID=A0A915L6S7_ROMCU